MSAPKYAIFDWAGNHLFQEYEFETFEDAWEHLYTTFPEMGEDAFEEYYVEQINGESK
jgi:hypothetical protein